MWVRSNDSIGWSDTVAVAKALDSYRSSFRLGGEPSVVPWPLSKFGAGSNLREGSPLRRRGRTRTEVE